MPNLKEHIKISKHLFLVLFVLFALSSCSAKQSILNTFDLDLSETANKTRATGNAINNCSFVNLANKKEQGNRYVLKKANFHGYDSKGNVLSAWWLNATTPNDNVGVIPGNSPPKYILFKRLKVCAA